MAKATSRSAKPATSHRACFPDSSFTVSLMQYARASSNPIDTYIGNKSMAPLPSIYNPRKSSISRRREREAEKMPKSPRKSIALPQAGTSQAATSTLKAEMKNQILGLNFPGHSGRSSTFGTFGSIFKLTELRDPTVKPIPKSSASPRINQAL